MDNISAWPVRAINYSRASLDSHRQEYFILDILYNTIYSLSLSNVERFNNPSFREVFIKLFHQFSMNQLLIPVPNRICEIFGKQGFQIDPLTIEEMLL